MVSCMNKENNVFKDGIGVKGLRFKLHGNNHGNHLEHYGIHHDNHGNHHGVIITVIKVIELLQSEVGPKKSAIFVYFITMIILITVMLTMITAVITTKLEP